MKKGKDLTVTEDEILVPVDAKPSYTSITNSGSTIAVKHEHEKYKHKIVARKVTF